MGRLGNRYYLGRGPRGGRPKGDLGPMRRIVEVLAPAANLFDAAFVKLECGHFARSNGAFRAHCGSCRDMKEGS